MKQKSRPVPAKQPRSKTKRRSVAAIPALLTADAVRAIVREEVKCALANNTDGWLPIADAPRNKWLLVSAGGPLTNPGAVGWQIARVTDKSLRGSSPSAECLGGGGYMGVKWYMELPPLRVDHEAQKTVVVEVTDVWHSCDTETPPEGEELELGYPNAPCAFNAIRYGRDWYDTEVDSCGNRPRLSDDLQHPSIWRRPVHQEHRPA